MLVFMLLVGCRDKTTPIVSNPDEEVLDTDVVDTGSASEPSSTSEPASQPASEPEAQPTSEPAQEDTATDTDPDATREGWVLVWRDEFSGNEIDMSKWSFEVNGQGGGNNELQYYTDRSDNARIENGALVIEARSESFTGSDGTRDYTSARLRTANKGDWTYGRIEARIRLPFGQGIWPAFWMLPTDWVYGGWAASGEIDIMELVGHEPNVVHGTLHYGGPWPENTYSGDGYSIDEPFANDFHTFAV